MDDRRICDGVCVNLYAILGRTLDRMSTLKTHNDQIQRVYSHCNHIHLHIHTGYYGNDAGHAFTDQHSLKKSFTSKSKLKT